MKGYIYSIFFFSLFLFSANNLFSQNLHRTNLYIISDNQNEININISGNIILKQFFGPPNYGEMPEIDKTETYYVLQLNEAITFIQGNNKEIVNEIQLVFIDSINLELKKDCNYIVKGNAFFAHTGHHHTPIILFVVMIILDNGI
jgi:hypothetical protein